MRAAAVYARVSTLDQEREGTSLKTQISACEKHAKEKGYQVTHTIKDAFSGLTVDRPGLQEVLGLIKGNHIDALTIYSTDRFSRDGLDLLNLVRESELNGVELLCVSEDLYQGHVGQLLNFVRGWAGSLEAQKIKERTMRGSRAAVKQGKWVGGRVKYGYNYCQETRNLEENEAEAEVVRGLFNWVAEGKTAASWCRWANYLGIPTKQKSKAWRTQQVSMMLRDTAYTGKGAWGKVTRRNGKQMPGHDPIPMHYPPIISEDIFRRVQARLSQNKRKNSGTTKHFYMLQHLGRCGECGGPLCCHTMGHHRYLYCYRQRFMPHLSQCYQPQTWHMEEAEEYIWADIEDILDNYRDGLLDRLIAQHNGVEQSLDATIAKATKELERCKLERQRILTAIRKGWATEAEASLQFKAISADEEQWKEEMVRAETSREGIAAIQDAIQDQIGKVFVTFDFWWYTTFGLTGEQKREIINAILDSFVLYRDGRIELRLKVPNNYEVVNVLTQSLFDKPNKVDIGGLHLTSY